MITDGQDNLIIVNFITPPKVIESGNKRRKKKNKRKRKRQREREREGKGAEKKKR